MYDTPTRVFPPLGEPPPEPAEEPPDRRRWLAYSAIAAAAVLVVVIPIALVLLLRSDGGPAGQRPSATPSATPAATGTASPSVSPTPTATAPDGRISAATLKNATLDVPPWPVDNVTGPAGPIKFTNGEYTAPPSAEFPTPPHLVIFNIVYGDVDRDGAQETVAALFCGWQGGSTQLVAFDRDGAGDIVTLGRVVATTGEVRTIGLEATRILDDGTVQTRVGDYLRCCGDETPQLWQARGYRWNGHAFTQYTGPLSFPVNPAVTETAVTTGELVLGTPVGGVQQGTITVRISYLRGAKPTKVALHFYSMAGLQRDGTAWPPVRNDGAESWTVDVTAPALGGTATYTFAFGTTTAAAPASFEINAVALGSNGTGLSESNPYNNSVGVTVRTTR